MKPSLLLPALLSVLFVKADIFVKDLPGSLAGVKASAGNLIASLLLIARRNNELGYPHANAITTLEDADEMVRSMQVFGPPLGDDDIVFHFVNDPASEAHAVNLNSALGVFYFLTRFIPSDMFPQVVLLAVLTWQTAAKGSHKIDDLDNTEYMRYFNELYKGNVEGKNFPGDDATPLELTMASIYAAALASGRA